MVGGIYGLLVASKLLEMIICDHTTTFIEKNGILPTSQHRLRSAKSTMSAWADKTGDWNSPVGSASSIWHLGSRVIVSEIGDLSHTSCYYWMNEWMNEWINEWKVYLS